MNQCQINELGTRHNITSTICNMTPKHLDTFGKRVRILRHGVGMNQQDLVNALERYGVSIGRSYVSELERTDKLRQELQTKAQELTAYQNSGAVADRIDDIRQDGHEMIDLARIEPVEVQRWMKAHFRIWIGRNGIERIRVV